MHALIVLLDARTDAERRSLNDRLTQLSSS
jgi:hypothetical protein